MIVIKIKPAVYPGKGFISSGSISIGIAKAYVEDSTTRQGQRQEQEQHLTEPIER